MDDASFTWIYIVSDYFKSSAKMLKIEHFSYAYLPVLFLPFDGRRRGGPIALTLETCEKVSREIANAQITLNWK